MAGSSARSWTVRRSTRTWLSTRPAGPGGSVACPGERDADQLGGDCGLAYIDRTYRLREGAAPGPMMTHPSVSSVSSAVTSACCSSTRRRHFSVVLVGPRPTPSSRLLHSQVAFEAAWRAIPVLAEWTEPARAVPTSEVLVGGALRNVYRQQTPSQAWSRSATRSPRRRRHAAAAIAMACMQIEALLRLLDEGADRSRVDDRSTRGATGHIKPWVADHIAIDGGMEQALEGRGHRPEHAAHLRPDRGRRAGRATHRARRRRLLR